MSVVVDHVNNLLSKHDMHLQKVSWQCILRGSLRPLFLMKSQIQESR